MLLSQFSLLRVAVCSPEVRVADTQFNSARINDVIRESVKLGCSLTVFPELCITGYTCGDLFYQSVLRLSAEQALQEICYCTETTSSTVIVGMPVHVAGKMFNCAILISCGRIIGVVPKTYLPNTAEYYEERWFSSANDIEEKSIVLCGEEVPFGTDLLFVASQDERIVIGCEICEDVWSVIPPSSAQALAGATIITNLSASVELLSKRSYREELLRTQSARCLAAYLYSAAGPGESSTDTVFSGHCLIAENGAIIAETERFSFDTQIAYADIDIERLVNERIKNSSYGFGCVHGYRKITFELHERKVETLLRQFASTPFVPGKQDERKDVCREIMMIQSTGLAKRLKHIGCKKVVIGLSGGLDSTLALLVCLRTFHRLKYDTKGIIAVTMPGFGTTDRTKSNAERLAELANITLRQISIHAAVEQHFLDIGHNPSIHDLVYENAQARERTQILMDVAQQEGGIVIGTGDMSELALGWCTYNGDHMSMYGVNSGVPKTLVRYIVEWAADEEYSGELAEVLRDICATPVSPELLPPDSDGNIIQKTEETIGPYILHDFFLYYVVRFGFSPKKIFFIACETFSKEYEKDTIKKWLKEFYKRFFGQQFKRSCLPDGMKIGSVALSPRGDWRMPSDASATLWLRELDEL